MRVENSLKLSFMEQEEKGKISVLTAQLNWTFLLLISSKKKICTFLSLSLK